MFLFPFPSFSLFPLQEEEGVGRKGLINCFAQAGAHLLLNDYLNGLIDFTYLPNFPQLGDGF